MELELKHNYLKENVYKGLTNLNSGWDSPYIYYFSEEDFNIVLNRIEELGIGIYGIEPWDMDNNYYDVKGYEEYNTNPSDPIWYRKAFEEFKATGEKLKYAASYYVLDDLLK